MRASCPDPPSARNTSPKGPAASRWWYAYPAKDLSPTLLTIQDGEVDPQPRLDERVNERGGGQERPERDLDVAQRYVPLGLSRPRARGNQPQPPDHRADDRAEEQRDQDRLPAEIGADDGQELA